MSFLFGSAPKASFSTQSTTSPQQQALLDPILQMIFEGMVPQGLHAYTPTYGYTGTFSAPLSGLETTSLSALENAVNSIWAGGMDPSQSALYDTAVQQALSGLTGGADIDATKTFQEGVVQPVTTDFLNKTLPAIQGKYGAGAGGAYSSDALMARTNAADTVSRALAAEGSKYALDAARSNQATRLAYEGLVPALTALPGATQQQTMTNLLLGLQGGAVPRQQQQTQVAGMYGDYLNTQQQWNTIISQLLAAFGTPTQQTVGVGTGGQSGLLGGLLGNSGLGTAFGTWLFSDERLKEDMEQIGDVDGIPLYKFRYKGESEPRLGFSAQDIEKRVPHAVATTPSGYKAVNYNTVIADVLEAA